MPDGSPDPFPKEREGNLSEGRLCGKRDKRSGNRQKPEPSPPDFLFRSVVRSFSRGA